MFFLIVIAIIIIVCVAKASNSGVSTSNTTEVTTSQSPSTSDFGGLTPGSYKDACFALACLVGYSALKDPDELSSSLFIRDNWKEEKTEIHACGHCWVTNYRNIAEYRNIGVPAYIANYLAQLPYDETCWNENRSLVLRFNRSSNIDSTKQRILEGLNHLPYKPDICQLRSYPLAGNSTTTCIDLTVSKD